MKSNREIIDKIEFVFFEEFEQSTGTAIEISDCLDAMKQAQIEIMEELWRRLDKNGYKFNSISHIIDNLMIELKEELK